MHKLYHQNIFIFNHLKINNDDLRINIDKLIKKRTD